MVGFKGALSNFNFETLCFIGPLFIILGLFLVPSRGNYLKTSPCYLVGIPHGTGYAPRTQQRFGEMILVANGFTTRPKYPESNPRSSACLSTCRGRTSRCTQIVVLTVFSPDRQPQQHLFARKANLWVPPQNSQKL